jgi:hypothetical protein
MEAAVRAFFDRYARFFNHAITDTIDVDGIAAVYTSEFIAASPAGVVTGKNDDSLKSIIEQRFAHYRAIGTKEMRVERIRVTPIDDLHCLASIRWKSIYRCEDGPDVEIDFDAHYLVQSLDGNPKIFGWVTGDEQALLRRHGIG